ncbi:MAG: response regulator [Planctomycetota bacterium]|nr:response regulator [Planctomycetota bacterium]
MDWLDILMVEDNGGDVVLLDEAFARTGIAHRVHVATDGVEALAYLRRQGPYADAPRPDVIVLDLKMPRKGGREVLAELLPDTDLQAIPVVVLSSSQSELELIKHQVPAEHCIAKPFSFEGYLQIARFIGSLGRPATGQGAGARP